MHASLSPQVEPRSSALACPLCGSATHQTNPSQKGYDGKTTFEIRECATCEASVAFPRSVESDYYDRVYARRQSSPPYARYEVLARAAADHPDVLDLLARSEDYYALVARYFSTVPPGKKILEIGSGFGYLAHGLAQRGYDVTGIDVCREAVDTAIRRFGPRFRCCDLETFSLETPHRFDVILAVEVIEHIPDIHSFLKAAEKLLAPGGEIVLTTPDKTHFAGIFSWRTELPPLHLWWLSEGTMRALAQLRGYQLRFVDFAGTSPLAHRENRFFVTLYQWLLPFRRLHRWGSYTYLLIQGMRNQWKRIRARCFTLCVVFRRKSDG